MPRNLNVQKSKCTKSKQPNPNGRKSKLLIQTANAQPTVVLFDDELLELDFVLNSLNSSKTGISVNKVSGSDES